MKIWGSCNSPACLNLSCLSSTVTDQVTRRAESLNVAKKNFKKTRDLCVYVLPNPDRYIPGVLKKGAQMLALNSGGTTAASRGSTQPGPLFPRGAAAKNCLAKLYRIRAKRPVAPAVFPFKGSGVGWVRIC